MKPIRKAVFPVAGLGTRFLPATKAIPKEMLPIVDRPLIQYVVDEAREAGIEQMIFVTGRGKGAIEDHFDIAFELEKTMTERGKDISSLKSTRLEPGDCAYVRQQEALGLGHAIWCARDIVGDDPFALLLPDEFMHGEPGCMKQMVDAYARVGGNLLSILEVPRDQVSSYGVIAPGETSGCLTQIKALVEKPSVESAPSNLILSGRYILQPEVMHVLAAHKKGIGGEIQLTDALSAMMGDSETGTSRSSAHVFSAFRFNGQRFDCGSKSGYVAANLAIALEREDMQSEVAAMARTILAEKHL